ncbi:MAG: GNAT family N-acetyltransferase [Candidatus Undinarchaeales archaeon]|jgi:GNAT superfamily N-acetyltransferase|nr:GNAT family N-acetyltransferase [Candidatus Undinarchaeales archaeon]MDP7492730.1 GNAT family N-acetyltransferase [Candidatus Undinarchaeales archaeon]
MQPVVRPFREEDIPALIEMLTLNGQYDYPEIEGPEAMRRVAACDAAVFLVAEVEGRSVGLVRAVYDGSRALVHLLSVHPDQQGRGVGTTLLQACVDELVRRGAPTVSVTVSEASAAFWEKVGFARLPVFVMLKEVER